MMHDVGMATNSVRTMAGTELDADYDAPSDDPMPECNEPLTVHPEGSPTQWATMNGLTYCAVGKTSQTLPPGAYDIDSTPSGITFNRNEIDTNNLMHLPDSVSARVVDEIEKFWERGDRYKKYRINQRRGVLMTGPTGCGKTCTIKIICADVIRRGGVIFPYTNPRLLMAGLGLFRTIQPETPIVIVLEDLEGLCRGSNMSYMLNMIDGIHSMCNRVVFLATTNYPEMLESRITNRPSRFDCVVEMAQPSYDSRMVYLRNLAGDIDPDVFSIDRAVDDTDGLNFGHLQELFVSVVVYDMSYDDAVAKIIKMATEQLPSGDEMDRIPRGKSIGFGTKRALR